LYYLRELLNRKSGGIVQLRAEELAAIVTAAYQSIGRKMPKDQEDGDNLFRQLRRFSKNNPEFVDAVDRRIKTSTIPPIRTR
jgi:hypothetical protein